MRQRVATNELEPRSIDRQQWPVVNLVDQVGPDEWVVVMELCDGLPAGVQKFNTEQEALAAIGVPGPGAWKTEAGKVVKIGDTS
jgi:hypothetical protein